jgi:hypothetical protein
VEGWGSGAIDVRIRVCVCTEQRTPRAYTTAYTPHDQGCYGSHFFAIRPTRPQAASGTRGCVVQRQESEEQLRAVPSSKDQGEYTCKGLCICAEHPDSVTKLDLRADRAHVKVTFAFMPMRTAGRSCLPLHQPPALS